ncbi:hypothetical protein [Deinococcus cellulosilyticus]|uniref:Uncharacterized protein n=1 Tax=Deinococcus cellulosilyticus (strain DSM 18568 / NBRC 106333 / KACC 11606 / 5516J-15) TaxID=1223518 RepID=A0A511N9I6_DEIC1|nr:hypothetical protein [Deinococcus cellulosilyticus]GEM49460.1 hypothetical protein DC3_50950 [Deinococcus cellulosilyticus NBRC 106333 = KACC 11606]
MMNKSQKQMELIFAGLFSLMALTGLAFGILQVWDISVLQPDRTLTFFELFSTVTHLMWWPLVSLLLLLAPRLQKNTERAQ